MLRHPCPYPDLAVHSNGDIYCRACGFPAGRITPPPAKKGAK